MTIDKKIIDMYIALLEAKEQSMTSELSLLKGRSEIMESHYAIREGTKNGLLIAKNLAIQFLQDGNE